MTRHGPAEQARDRNPADREGRAEGRGRLGADAAQVEHGEVDEREREEDPKLVTRAIAAELPT
jgi:hypothetical protein